MCTLAFYYNVVSGFPLFAAANRDEYYDRPSAPPGILDTKPIVMAGRDLRAGGTWLGVNDHGVLAAVLNRRSRLVEEPGVGIRSRGLLCLDLLRSTSSAEACSYLKKHSIRYQPFTLLIADFVTAWKAHNDRDEIKLRALEPGLHVFSSTAVLDARSEKVDRVRARFLQAAEAFDKDTGLAADWVPRIRSVLSDHDLGNDSHEPRDALCVHGKDSGTVSSSVIAYSSSECCFRTFFSPGAPCQNGFFEAPRLLVR